MHSSHCVLSHFARFAWVKAATWGTTLFVDLEFYGLYEQFVALLQRNIVIAGFHLGDLENDFFPD